MESREQPFSSTFEAMLREFRNRWEAGEQPHAESYLSRLDPSRPYEASELIYQEYCLAKKAGLSVAPSAFLQRFPDHQRSLSRLFAFHETLATSELREWGFSCPLPEPGDEIGPYRLIRLLGQGGFARVFLAQQADLDDRLLVVKVSARITTEPRLLARLRHPHVVEVIRHAATTDGKLQLICMPFLGGATLSDALKAVKDRKRPPKSGLDLLACLDRVSAKEFPDTQAHSPAREIISNLTYPKAMAWIVARLAEALDHADRRGVIHGDVKPSNILIPADGMPMLFDFNLSVDWFDQDTLKGPLDQIGGTLAYLPPERLDSLLGSPTPAPLSGRQPHRADLYSLGLVLLEAVSRCSVVPRADLTFGPRAMIADLAQDRRQGPAAFAKLFRKTPSSLRPILKHLLTADPADRFARGHELATDLDCWIADRPTPFTDGPAWPVRLGKLVRRQRRWVAGVAIVLLSVATTLFVANIRHENEATRLAKEQLAYRLDKGDAGVFLYRRYGDWQSEQGDPAPILKAYRVTEPGDWRLHESVASLPIREREELEALILDQSYKLVKKLMDRPHSRDDWKEALTLVDKTLTRLPLRVFKHLRLRLVEQLGNDGREPLTATSTRDAPKYLEDYMDGVEASESHARVAFECFERVLKQKPDFFWALYRISNVACRLDFYPTAEHYFRKCVERRPDNPVLRTLFSALLFKNKKLTEAITECETALQLDRHSQEACYTLAKLKRVAAQKDGLAKAIGRLVVLRNGAPDSVEEKFLDLSTALQYGAIFDFVPEVNEKDLRELLTDHPDNQVARVILATYLGRSDRFKESIDEYDLVLKRNPEHLWARYSRALVLGKMHHPEANREFVALIDHPRFEELFREDPYAIHLYRFVVNHHLEDGEYTRAREAATDGLVHAKRRNMAKSQSYYTMARSLAHFAESDPSVLAECARYLCEARVYKQDILDKWYPNDAIFDGVRSQLLPIISKPKFASQP